MNHFFWDGRAESLKDQVNGPVHNPLEMGTNWPEVIKKLSQDKKFLAAYRSVYKGQLSDKNIIEAIVEYESH